MSVLRNATSAVFWSADFGFVGGSLAGGAVVETGVAAWIGVADSAFDLGAAEGSLLFGEGDLRAGAGELGC